MKRSKLNYVVSSLMLMGGLVTFGPADAHEPAAASPKSGAAAETPIPSTAEGIWVAIDQKTAELKTTVKSGKLAEVHHLAFAVRDLVAALPEKSTTLTADQQAKVKGSVKFVATLAERLDASGDANDQAATQDNCEKLLKVLESLHANYATKAAS